MRSRRLDLGLTQEELAAKVGARQAMISRWENHSIPQADTVLRIADALGVSVRWLLTGEHHAPAEVSEPPAAA